MRRSVRTDIPISISGFAIQAVSCVFFVHPAIIEETELRGENEFSYHMVMKKVLT